MRILTLFLVLLGAKAWAHVPALLLPIEGTPITSYFIGQSDVSRAVYSELTEDSRLFILHFQVKESEDKTLIQLQTPYCENIPTYESFQPSALLIAGEVPWKLEGENEESYIQRLEQSSLTKISSNYVTGERPTFYEEYGDQTYWKGGEWQSHLKPGLYGLVLYDEGGGLGNFTIGLNEKEAWTAELYRYVEMVMPKIKAGICSPEGFTGLKK